MKKKLVFFMFFICVLSSLFANEIRYIVTNDIKARSCEDSNDNKQFVKDEELIFTYESLLDYYNHSINLPAYFILRNIYNTIEHDYKVHVIQGNNYSGKTYFLASILQKFSTSETYFFESKNQISDSAFKYLLTKKNCLFVFDSK